MTTYETLYASTVEHHEEQIKGYKELIKVIEQERDYWFNKYIKEIQKCTVSQSSYLESSQAARLYTLTQQEQ